MRMKYGGGWVTGLLGKGGQGTSGVCRPLRAGRAHGTEAVVTEAVAWATIRDNAWFVRCHGTRYRSGSVKK